MHAANGCRAGGSVAGAAGHAIECRVYAEDADAGFCPRRAMTSLRVPSGPGIRDDGWAEAGTDVPVFYDPLISKLIAWGATGRRRLRGCVVR